MKHEDLGWLAAERQSRNHSPQLGRWGTASWAFTSRYPLGSEGSQEAPGAWLWYFGHLMQRTDSLEKTLMLGKTEGRRRG